MSLEQAIAEQTAAIKEQTAVLTKLVTAISVIAASAGKATLAAAEPAATEAPKEEKMTRRKREAAMDIPVVDPDNLPEGDAKKSPLPEGERNDAFYKEHVQPVLLGLAAVDKEVLKDMFKKFGVAKGSELKPADWDAAVIAAAALKEEVIARDKRLKEEADADLA